MPKINLPPGWSEANVRAFFEVSTGRPQSGERATPKELNAFIKSQQSSFERSPRSFPKVMGFQQRPGSPSAPAREVSATRAPSPKSPTGSPPPLPAGMAVSMPSSALAKAHTQRAATMLGVGQGRLAKAQAQLPRVDLLPTPAQRKTRVAQTMELLKAARSCCAHARASAQAGGEVPMSAVTTLEAQILELATALRAKVDTRAPLPPHVAAAEQPLPHASLQEADRTASRSGLKSAGKPPTISTSQHRITGVQLNELKKLFTTKLNLADQAHAQQKAANGLSSQAKNRTDLVAARREVARAKGQASHAKAELQKVSNALVLKWNALQDRIDPNEQRQFLRLRGQIQEAQALCRGWEDELAATHENLGASILKLDREVLERDLLAEGSEASRLMAQATGELRLEQLGDPVTEQLERRLQQLRGDAPSEAEIIRRLHAL